MDVSNLLSHDTPPEIRTQQAGQASPQQEHQRSHPYPTRNTTFATSQSTGQGLTTPSNTQSYNNNVHHSTKEFDHSPPSPTPKNVAFELLFEGASNYRARLPMRVQIFPHDTTDSIVTTVKNFYGLYEGTAKGVSFEDERQHTLIARYENFQNNMVVYVRVIPDYSQQQQPDGQMVCHPTSPLSGHRIPHLDEPVQMLPPQHSQPLAYGEPPSRPQSRVARKRSLSPHNSRNRRSTSAQKTRPRSGIKSREPSVHGGAEDLNDNINGYSSSDCGAGSVSSSRKARSEQLVSSEISATNILEGGRRKRAKFESSELPLFVPPQVPAPSSISSISPQRRSIGQENPSPFPRPAQRTFAYSQPLQSPQSYSYSDNSHGMAPVNGTAYSIPQAQHSHRLRDRVTTPHISTRASSRAVPRGQGFGILPTPDPTIASCISDEDVALQLMRLGDASNLSHGRTSASTLDDALSSRANVPSSATSESGDDSETVEQPPLPANSAQAKLSASPTPPSALTNKAHGNLHEVIHSLDTTEQGGNEGDGDYLYDGKKDGVFKSDPDDMANEFGLGNRPKLPVNKSGSGGAPKSRIGGPKKVLKPARPRSIGVSKKPKPSSLSTGFKTPLSPASLTPQSRKTSSASTLNFQHQLGADEEDLSSKPRCQRCRKSKKGCDRQRPCQRCQDAGIGADGCISEDEGNGRKGRFGRHMGVSVKKDQDLSVRSDFETADAASSGAVGTSEKSKKRKR